MPLPSLCSALCSWLLLCLWRREDRAGPTGLADRVNVLGPQLVRSCCRLLGVLQRACSLDIAKRGAFAFRPRGDGGPRSDGKPPAFILAKIDTQRLFIKIPVHMKHYLLNGSNLQPKLVANFGDLGSSHLKTLRLTPLGRWGRPSQLGPLNQQPPVSQLGHELELPNVVFTDLTKFDIDQPLYLFRKWSHFNSHNSVANCYLSSKYGIYGIDDFYQFWVDNWDESTNPFLNKVLFFNDRANQCLINIELKKSLLTNTELISEQQKQLLENEVILALDSRIANETSAQMVRQNSDGLDASIERANAQLAEAHFQVLEDRLDTSVELEISNHLQQMDWTDWELSNQISHLHTDCITSKRGGFLLTSGAPDGSGGSSGHGGSWGGSGRGGPPRGYGGEPSGPEPSGFPRKIFLLVGLSTSYAAYRWFLQESRKDLELELSQRELQKQEELLPTESGSRPPQGEILKATAKSKPDRSIVPLWGAPVFGRGLLRGLFRGFGDGLLLVRSFLCGPDLFVRAVRVVVYPVVRQFSEFLLSSFLRGFLSALFRPFSFFSPFIGFITSFGSAALTPIYGLLTFFISINVLKGVLSFIFAQVAGPEIIPAVVPMGEHFFYMIQGFFATNPEASVSAAFLERGIKVFSITFAFGKFCNNFHLLVFPEKGESPSVRNQRVRALVLIGLFGFSIYLVLFDHMYISMFVQKTLQVVPSVEEFAAGSFGQASFLLGSSVIVQSAGFPYVVTVLYAWLLYISGLYSALIKEPPSPPEASPPENASAKGWPPNSQK